MIEDCLNYSRGWGFRREEMASTGPGVACLDAFVPIEHALQPAVSLPPCRIFVDPDEASTSYDAGWRRS